MKAIILATDGFEDSEFNYPYYRLQEYGADVDIVGPSDHDEITGKYGYTWSVDLSVDAHTPQEWVSAYDLLVIPGGSSPEKLRTDAPMAADIVNAFDEHDKPIAAICHGPQLLISAGILEGRTVTGYWSLEVDLVNAGATFSDETTVVDENLITARVPADLPAFMASTFEVCEETTIPA